MKRKKKKATRITNYKVVIISVMIGKSNKTFWHVILAADTRY